jgi:hypothetical protein
MIRHVAPWMIFWGWLWEPNITTVTYKMKLGCYITSNIDFCFASKHILCQLVLELPATCPLEQASATACVSISAPRALLTIKTPFFNLAILFLSNNPLNHKK